MLQSSYIPITLLLSFSIFSFYQRNELIRSIGIFIPPILQVQGRADRLDSYDLTRGSIQWWESASSNNLSISAGRVYVSGLKTTKAAFVFKMLLSGRVNESKLHFSTVFSLSWIR